MVESAEGAATAEADGIDVFEPATGAVLRRVRADGAAEVDAALAAAREALPRWRGLAPTERGRRLHRIADGIRARHAEIAEIEAANTGKSPRDVRRSIMRAADCFSYYGGYADKATGSTIPLGPGFHTYTEREPFGVSVGIVPWNNPFFHAVKKIAPAIAFGNVSILKPSPDTPLSALLLHEIVQEELADPGVSQVIVGGLEAGRALTEDPRTDLIVFTGHHDTGKAIARAAADNLTPMALELGGKSPQLVFADADLDAALRGVLLGIFASCGQMCIAGSRLFVQEEIREEFVGRLAEAVTGLRVGDMREDGTQVGPQTTRAQAGKSLGMIERARADGGRILAQAQLPTSDRLRDGFYVPPTVFDGLDAEDELMREEVFGPVLAVASFTDEQDALRRAAETPFGLAAGVWTQNVARAHRVARGLSVGNVWINSYRVLSDLVPFGGVGLSGYGREGGEDSVHLYTRSKSVWTALDPDVTSGFGI